LAQNEDDKQQEERSRLDRPTIFDVAQEMQAEEAERKQAFLVSFSESGHLGRACRDAHVTRTQFTAWLERDPAFKEMYDDIYEEQADDTEKALLELIKDDGTPAATRLGAIKLHLEARRREVYKRSNDTAGAVAPRINIYLGSKPSPEQPALPQPPPIDIRAHGEEKK
jgi:hypothetical protein